MTNERIFEYRGYWLGHRSESPHWQVFWRLPGSRRVHRKSTKTSNLDAAKEVLLSFAGRRELSPVREPVWLRLETALDLYKENKRGTASEETTQICAKHLMDFASNSKIEYVSQFTMDHQAHYARWRRKDLQAAGFRGSNGTINRELVVLRAAFRFAQRCGRTVDVPFVQLLPEPPPRELVLTADECRKLLAHCHEEHIHLFTLLALHTLQRPGAILDLKCEQVDFVNNRIDFRRLDQPVTTKRRPVIPITNHLWPHLANAVQKSQSGYVVEYNGRRLKSVRAGFTTAAKSAGFEKLTPICLRHTGATLLAAAGVSFYQISGMMGHTQSRTTERYAKYKPDYMQEATAELDELY